MNTPEENRREKYDYLEGYYEQMALLDNECRFCTYFRSCDWKEYGQRCEQYREDNE